MANWSIPEKLRSALWGKAQGIQGWENIKDFSHLTLTSQSQNCHCPSIPRHSWLWRVSALFTTLDTVLISIVHPSSQRHLIPMFFQISYNFHTIYLSQIQLLMHFNWRQIHICYVIFSNHSSSINEALQMSQKLRCLLRDLYDWGL